MRLSIVVAVVLVVLLAGSVPGAVAAAPDGPAAETPASQSQDRATQPAIANGSTLERADPAQVIRINVTESGDAVWTIESRFLLSDEDEADAFLEYAEAIAAGEREGVYDRSLFDPHVETAADATDREMTIQDAGWDEPRLLTGDDHGPDDSEATVGVLSYSFTWTEFAAVDGNRIHVGDAFQSADGPWLSALAEDQRLVIQSPSNYGFHDYNLPVSPEDSALVVDGPYQFSESELEATFLQGAGNTPPGSDGGLLPASAELLLGGLFVLVVIVGAAGYALARWSSDSDWLPAAQVADVLADDDPDRTADASEPSDANGTADRRTRSTTSAPVQERATDSGRQGMADASAGQAFAYVEDEDEDEDDVVDPELLSDEERVLRLLRRNGGRMKQGSIVSETGWSNAKVSQLLSQMADDGEIEKLRIGRENLITLPEVDPTEID